jgi:two-component system KDP operon response regulator KdpE
MGYKILIADDDMQITAALARRLSDYSVVVAHDGKAALALAASEKPDIVLLDISMPVMSGIEVLGKLAGLAKKPLVIMLTGDESVDTVSKAMSLGVFSYITKPFEFLEVSDQIRKAVEFLEK